MSRKPNSKCEICGKERYRRPSELKRNKHNCCRGCRSELYKKSKNYSKKGLAIGRGWNKGKSKKGGDVLTYGKPRSEKTKKNISLSLIGREFSEEHRNKLRERMVERRGRQKKKGTNIENILERWFIEKGIVFEKQKPILNLCNPDFFVKPNNCVFADGDYWHSFENVKKRDKNINGKLIEKGYSVIRLSGTEIINGVRPNELL